MPPCSARPDTTVPNPFRTRPAPVPHRFRTGAAPVPPPFRSRPARVPANSPEGEKKLGVFLRFCVCFRAFGGVFVFFGGVFARRGRAAHPPAFRTRSALCSALCSALAPHLLRTCSALAPHLLRTCSALVPHLCRTCDALAPHCGRICGAASSDAGHPGLLTRIKQDRPLTVRLDPCVNSRHGRPIIIKGRAPRQAEGRR